MLYTQLDNQVSVAKMLINQSQILCPVFQTDLVTLLKQKRIDVTISMLAFLCNLDPFKGYTRGDPEVIGLLL